MKNAEVRKLLETFPDADIVLFRQGSSARNARPVPVAISELHAGERYLDEGEQPDWHEKLGIAFISDNSSSSAHQEGRKARRKRLRVMQEHVEQEGASAL